MGDKILNLTKVDPFAGGDLDGEDWGGDKVDAPVIKPCVVHLRVQKRNARKAMTTIQGLRPDVDINKILLTFRKLFACNGTIIKDPDLGNIIQLQGDQRHQVARFFIDEGILDKSEIKIHGF